MNSVHAWLASWPQLQWAQAEWLWLLPAVPLWLARHRRRPVDLTPARWVLLHPWLQDGPTGEHAPAGRRAALLLRALAWLALVLALAQPREIVQWNDPPAIGRDIALVVDVSDSMTRADLQAEGQAVSRIQLVRELLTRFVRERSADRFTLMVYGQGAAVLMPPTFDRLHTLYQIQRLQTGLLGDGTALGDALALAVRTIRHRELAPTVVLVGDGDGSNSGQVLPAEALAAALGAQVRIHALQLGRAAPEAADAAQPGLHDMARLSGGRYRAVTSLAQGLDFLREVDQAAPTLRPPPEQPVVREWFAVPLGLACALLLLALGLDWHAGRARGTGAAR